MPCWNVYRIKISLDKNTNPDLIAEALREMGYTIQQTGAYVSFGIGNFVNGELTIYEEINTEEFTRKLKRNYSIAAIKQTAKRNGWQVETLRPMDGKNSYRVTTTPKTGYKGRS